MAQVSIPFCPKKPVFRALSIAPPSSVVRAGPKEEGKEEEMEMELQIGWETLKRACPSILIFLRGLSILEINQLNKLFSNSFSSSLYISEQLYRKISNTHN